MWISLKIKNDKIKLIKTSVFSNNCQTEGTVRQGGGDPDKFYQDKNVDNIEGRDKD